MGGWMGGRRGRTYRILRPRRRHLVVHILGDVGNQDRVALDVHVHGVGERGGVYRVVQPGELGQDLRHGFVGALVNHDAIGHLARGRAVAHTDFVVRERHGRIWWGRRVVERWVGVGWCGGVGADTRTDLLGIFRCWCFCSDWSCPRRRPGGRGRGGGGTGAALSSKPCLRWVGFGVGVS